MLHDSSQEASVIVDGPAAVVHEDAELFRGGIPQVADWISAWPKLAAEECARCSEARVSRCRLLLRDDATVLRNEPFVSALSIDRSAPCRARER